MPIGVPAGVCVRNLEPCGLVIMLLVMFVPLFKIYSECKLALTRSSVWVKDRFESLVVVMESFTAGLGL